MIITFISLQSNLSRAVNNSCYYVWLLVSKALREADFPSLVCLASRHELFSTCLNTHNDRQLNSLNMNTLKYQYRIIHFST